MDIYNGADLYARGIADMAASVGFPSEPIFREAKTAFELKTKGDLVGALAIEDRLRVLILKK